MRAPTTTQFTTFKGETLTLQSYRFDSLHAFGRYVSEIHAAEQWAFAVSKLAAASLEDENEVDEWHGDSFEGCLNALIHGGAAPESAVEIEAQLDKMNVARGLVLSEEPELDVYGGAVDVGEYLQNAPECFITMPEVEQAQPVVRVGIALEAASAMSNRMAANKGAALLQAVQLLENAGNRVEVIGVMCVADSTDPVRYSGLYTEIILKQPHETLNAQTIAYAVMNPATQRRAGFRLCEATDDQEAHHHQYGNSDTLQRELADQFNLFFPRISQWNFRQYSDHKITAEHVEKALNRVVQGVESTMVGEGAHVQFMLEQGGRR